MTSSTTWTRWEITNNHLPKLRTKKKQPQESKETIKTALCDKLELCIYPLDPEQHSDRLMNIVTGQVVNHSSVNVEKAQLLGKTQMESFERSWPGGVHDPIPKIVTTMALSRKHIKVGYVKAFDTETIYARAMGLQSWHNHANGPWTITYPNVYIRWKWKYEGCQNEI